MIKNLPNQKEMNAIIKKVFGKDGGTYIEGRSFSKGHAIWNTYGVKLNKMPYPDECPDIEHLAVFVSECKKVFGDDCPQAKAYVWYSRKEEVYFIMWEIKERDIDVSKCYS